MTNELILFNDRVKNYSWDDKVAWLAATIAPLQGALVERDDFGVKHMFKDNWYIREMRLPADFIFVGRRHLEGHIVKLLEGEANVLFADGNWHKYYAPSQLQTYPGFYMVVHTITEITAQSWHFNPDGCRNIDDLESEYFGPPSVVLERGAQLIQEALTWSAP